jgi:hypothetical protein
VWAFVLLGYVSEQLPLPSNEPSAPPPQIQHLLNTYRDVFSDPKTLPPPRAYDHAIPLIPGSIHINSMPYHYSPHHMTEIER